jgi:hypothetical protein
MAVYTNEHQFNNGLIEIICFLMGSNISKLKNPKPYMITNTDVFLLPEKIMF